MGIRRFPRVLVWKWIDIAQLLWDSSLIHLVRKYLIECCQKVFIFFEFVRSQNIFFLLLPFSRIFFLLLSFLAILKRMSAFSDVLLHSFFLQQNKSEIIFQITMIKESWVWTTDSWTLIKYDKVQSRNPHLIIVLQHFQIKTENFWLRVEFKFCNQTIWSTFLSL